MRIRDERSKIGPRPDTLCPHNGRSEESSMYGEGPADLHQRCLTSTLGPRPDKPALAQRA